MKKKKKLNVTQLVRAYERKLWVDRLKSTCGNVSQTAKALGVSPQWGFQRVVELKLKTEVAKARKACPRKTTKLSK